MPVTSVPWDTFLSLEKFLHVQRNFEYVAGQTPFSDWRIAVGISTGYLAFIFGFRLIMNQFSKPLPVKIISSIHNFNMFVVSLVCFVGQTYGLYDILARNKWDIDMLYCDASNKETLKGPLYFWVYLFYLSKFYELLDTVLLVCKKSRLRFLHVYHHWATGLLCFVCLNDGVPIQWIATFLNALVHIPMYYYYFMVDTFPGVKIWWKEYITQMQITQFITVNVVHWSAVFVALVIKDDCIGYWTYGNLAGFVILNSYLGLFLKLYRDTYSRPRAAAGKPANGANEPKKTK